MKNDKMTYQQTGALISTLVLRWSVDAVYARLEPTTSEVGNSVCQIHSDGTRLRRYPCPVAIFTQNLETRNRLAE